MTRSFAPFALAVALLVGAAAPAMALNMHVPKGIVMAAVGPDLEDQSKAVRPQPQATDARSFALAIADRLSSTFLERVVPGIAAAARGLANRQPVEIEVADAVEIISL